MPPVWDIDPVLFRLPFGDLAVRYYGIIFSLVFFGGFLLFRWQLARAGADELAYDIILPGFIGLVLGARLGHVFFYNFDLFRQNPSWVFRIWEGGLSSHGAALGLFGALLFLSKWKKRPLWDLCDRFTFSAALGAGLIRLGNFFNSEIVGRVTNSFWAVRFPRYDGTPDDLTPARYPSQLVECAMGLFILFALWFCDRALGREKRPRGALSAFFLLLYFSSRFLVEFIKERQNIADNFILSRGQLLSLPVVVLALILLFRTLKSTSAKASAEAASVAPQTSSTVLVKLKSRPGHKSKTKAAKKRGR
ncbi:MAG: prolipoprotein diacylglyceryl transferase [Deltaproteobacteria bacterium]|jgi:prolipoprotein diacylglyceryl transferase|nr:prolipoprotein diacylglyceryl transferase [Deltaproteobacteria bacterium]